MRPSSVLLFLVSVWLAAGNGVKLRILNTCASCPELAVMVDRVLTFQNLTYLRMTDYITMEGSGLTDIVFLTDSQVEAYLDKRQPDLAIPTNPPEHYFQSKVVLQHGLPLTMAITSGQQRPLTTLLSDSWYPTQNSTAGLRFINLAPDFGFLRVKAPTHTNSMHSQEIAPLQTTTFYSIAPKSSSFLVEKNGRVLTDVSVDAEAGFPYSVFLVPSQTPGVVSVLVVKETPTQADPKEVYFRVLHAVPRAPALDVYVDGELVGDFQLSRHSAYWPYPPGKHHITVSASMHSSTPGAIQCVTDVSPSANASTIVVMPSKNVSQKCAFVVLPDVTEPQLRDREGSLVRFLPLYFQAPALSLSVDHTILAREIAPGTFTGYNVAKSGVVDMCVHYRGQVYSCLQAVNLKSKHAYSLVAFTSAQHDGDMRLFVVRDGHVGDPAVQQWFPFMVPLVAMITSATAICLCLEWYFRSKKRPKRNKPMWTSYGTDLGNEEFQDERDTKVRFKNTPTLFSPVAYFTPGSHSFSALSGSTTYQASSINNL